MTITNIDLFLNMFSARFFSLLIKRTNLSAFAILLKPSSLSINGARLVKVVRQDLFSSGITSALLSLYLGSGRWRKILPAFH